MAALTSRLTVLGDPSEDAEDILSSALATIYPDDIANTHGDAAHALSYKSPHFPRPLLLHLSDPSGEAHRKLFSHYLWNASLLLAELIESASLGIALSPSLPKSDEVRLHQASLTSFNLKGQKCIELGAGAGLPSLMAALLGARAVTVTDYPSPEFLDTVRRNVRYNVKEEFSPLFTPEEAKREDDTNNTHGEKLADVLVLGHAWGTLPSDNTSFPKDADFERVKQQGECNNSPDDRDTPRSCPDTVDDSPPSLSDIPTLEGLPSSSLDHHHHHAYDRILVADCLWMSSQHDNLAASISFLLRRGNPQRKKAARKSINTDSTAHDNATVPLNEGGRALIVAGFHTGRQGMRGFLFSPPPRPTTTQIQDLTPSPHLQKHNLTIESIYERDCDGHERPWVWDRGFEDPGERKRWLVVAVLKPE